jgi:VWFA-related protein
MNMRLHPSKTIFYAFSWLALLLASTFPCPLNAQSKPSSATGSSEVFLTVTVASQEGKVLAGLPREKFLIHVDKEPQKISHFSNTSLPASVVIIFDLTASMKDNLLYKNIASAKEKFSLFFKASDPANEYALVSYGGQAKLIQDWTNDVDAILAGFDRIATDVPSGTFRLDELCSEGVEKLRGRSRPKRVFLLITDWLGDVQSVKPVKLRGLLQETNTLIYVVNIHTLNRGKPLNKGVNLGDALLELEGRKQLQEMVDLSGGMVLFSQGTTENFGNGLQWIATELRNQYLLSFQPPTSVKGDKEYPLRVRVTFSPDAPREFKQMKIRHRKYFIGKDR